MLRMKQRLDRVISLLLVLLMTAMVSAVLWQIATRYVLGSPSSWTEEVARYLMIWIGLIGGAYAVGQRIHLAVDLIRLKSGVQDAVIQIVIGLFAVLVLGVGGTLLVQLSFELGQTSPALSEALGIDVGIGYVYAALPISGLLTAFYALCALRHPEANGEGEAP